MRRLLVVLVALLGLGAGSPAWASPRFAVEPIAPLHAEQGDTIEVPFAVADHGDATTVIVLKISATNGIDFPERFGNCTYHETSIREMVQCRFEQAVEAGAFYRLSSPIAMVIDAGDEYEQVAFTFSWCSPDSSITCDLLGTPGDGPPLTLVPAAEPASMHEESGDMVVVKVERHWPLWTWLLLVAAVVALAGGVAWWVKRRRRGRRPTTSER